VVRLLIRLNRTKQEANSIEILEEILGLLKITQKDFLEGTRTRKIVLSNIVRV